MSGHSKWASIKHKKGALDAKRGKVFTKIIREMSIAARLGGGDAASNPRLRTAVDKAKSVNMPADNIKRAIQKGTGELEGTTYEDLTLEGYGPGGVAILVEGTTDNRNRTVSEIRHILTKNGGNLGSAGSVSYLFKPKGFIAIAKAKVSEEKLMEVALEAGADDIVDSGDLWEVYTTPIAGEKVALAHDGDPGTAWITAQFQGYANFGNLAQRAEGSGIVVDLGSVKAVSEVKASMYAAGQKVDIRAAAKDASSATALSDFPTTLKGSTTAGRQLDLTLDAPVKTRYILIHITSLPPESPGGGTYRGGISEIRVLG